MIKAHSYEVRATAVVLAYNQSRFIADAVNAVLSQKFDGLEVILSDDCSSDDTFEIMSQIASSYKGPHKIRLNKNEKKMIILVDGFIASAAALVATKMYPESKDYMVFCHQSQELGHRKMLRIMDVDPLLSLEMRLGEGTGAAIAYPLLAAAACFYNEMASFEAAGIKEV